MLPKRRLFAAAIILATAFVLLPQTANAQKSEFDKIVNHIKTNYHAKKVSVPFMWLAKLAVKVVRPAGVKSFNVTLFENLNFSRENLDLEMQNAMRTSFGPEWSSVLRVRSKDGDQAYMYMREDGKNVKIAVITINREDAAVVRATISPEKLAEFINDPKILGIRIGDKDDDAKTKTPEPEYRWDTDITDPNDK